MLFFKTIKDETFLNILFSLVFLGKTCNDLQKFIDNVPIEPKNYFYTWEDQKKYIAVILGFIFI